MKKDFLRCIVVGAGRIALSHIPHMIAHPKTQLVGIVEPNFFMRFVMKRLLNVPVYKSINQINDDQFDAAFILTPPNVHYNLSKYFLNKRKHVFLEKPLTLDPMHSEFLLKLAQENYVQFTCGYVYRHHPIYLKLKDFINCGEYGMPLKCNIRMVGNVVNSDSPKTWRSTGKGAGCLYDYGCHAIDLGMFLFGQPSSVTCLSKDELFQAGVIDRFTAKLHYEKSAYSETEIYCNWADKKVRKAGLTVEVHTEDNIISTDGQAITIKGAHDERYSIKDLDTDVTYYLRGEEFQNQINAFIINACNGKFEYLDVADAVKCDAIISELYEAKL